VGGKQKGFRVNKKKILVFVLPFLVFVGQSCTSCVASWTKLYKKRFSFTESLKNKEKKDLFFRKDFIEPFSQLVFSWNAFRPAKGCFSFFVQVRNARTGAWSKWCKMFDWSKQMQRSYFARLQGDLSYVYVRLETGKKNVADGFRIKISAVDGANLRSLRGFSVCASNFSKFKAEKITPDLLNLRSVYIRGVPKKSQMVLNHPRAEHMCSPTSCSMLVSFLNKKNIDPLCFAKNSFDRGLDTYGSWPFNAAHAFELCEGRKFFSVVRLDSFKTMHKQLSRGLPLVVSVRGALKGAPKEYNKGHLLLVIGWDAKRKQVICHDSALSEDRKTLKRYDIKDFLAAWERSRRLAYWVDNA